MRFHEEEHGLNRASRGWVLLRVEDEDQGEVVQVDYHILPVGDEGRHHLEMGCSCSPELMMWTADHLVYLHRPYDERGPLVQAEVLDILALHLAKS